jgi:uncharacterized protein YhaN
MRFLRLRFQQFAHFPDVTLDLADGQEGLHLVYGPNEAGKSAALRAIQGFLFGIPVQSPDTFRYGGPALRVQATLRSVDGTVRTLVRRKGAKQTLRDDADQPIGDEVLLRLLEGIPPERFTLLFGLGHAELVSGGQQLLKSGGAAGETLFAAAVGGIRLQRLLADMTAEADRLFKPRGEKLPLNKLLEDYKAATLAVKDLSTPGKVIADLRTREEGLRQRIDELERDLRARRTERARLERLQKAIPLLAEYQGYAGRLAAHEGASHLTEDFPARRQAAQTALAHHTAAVDQAAGKLKVLTAELETLAVPEALLAEGPAIAQISGELGQYQSAVRDLPAQEHLRDAHTAAARTMLGAIRPDLTLAEVETLRIPAVVRARIRERGETCQRAAGTVEQLATTVADLRGQRETLDRRFATLPEPSETAPLREALQLAREAIPAEREMGECVQTQGGIEERAAAALARLGLWIGPLEACERLPVPSAESLEEAERARAEIAADLLDRRRRLREAEDGRARTLEAIRALEGAGTVPSEGDLSGAREERDAQWGVIRERWLTAVPAAPADPATLDAYEGSVETADGVADRLRREAQRVTQHAQFTAQRDRQSDLIRSLKDEIGGLDARAAELQQGWDEAWSGCGIRPLPPREMRPWLQRREALLALGEERRALWTRQQTLREQVDRRRQHLGERFAAVAGEPAPADPEGSLEEHCVRVDAWVQTADRQRQDRAICDRDRQTLGDQIARAERDREAATARLGDARERWRDALAPLGLGPEMTPGEAQAMLDQMAALFTALERAQDPANRVREISAFIAEYEHRAREVLETLAPDLLEALRIEDAVRTLERRWMTAEKEEVRRDALRRQARDLEEEREGAERDREAADRLLAELLAEAGCQSIGELAAVEVAAAEKRDCRTHLARVEALLRPFIGAGTLETLAAEVALVHPDELPGQLAALDNEINDLDTAVKILYGQAGVARNELDAVTGDDRAAEKASEAQGLLARIRTEAARYLRGRLGAALLQQEIARYRETHAGELVQAAGALFARLTCGAFSGLGERLTEKEQPMLVGLRAAGGGTEEVAMEGMSDGTRDQLYLALRVAYLERHLERNPPFPLILDDVLVNFDDERAGAALAVFGELSRRTQVILFTHHQHLCDLARAAVPGGALFEHQLGG